MDRISGFGPEDRGSIPRRSAYRLNEVTSIDGSKNIKLRFNPLQFD